jgi:hypothetical protein
LKPIAAAVAFATVAGTGWVPDPVTAAALVHPLHALTKGEKFVYSRVVTFRDTAGIQHERSTITLEVVGFNGSTALVRQRISVNGGPEKAREIAAASDGRWSYTDHNSVAQDFATWDASQFGPAREDFQPGQTWQVDVPKSAMFTAGHATVKVVQADDKRLVVEADGDSGRRDDNILDNDTHKFVPVSVRGVWKTHAAYDNGILQEFHRTDFVHYNVNRGKAQTDDNVDVMIHIVTHTMM